MPSTSPRTTDPSAALPFSPCSAQASSLPRVPGRAVLAGVGTLQLSYMADVAAHSDTTAATSAM